jgi:sulfotransferase 6B1
LTDFFADSKMHYNARWNGLGSYPELHEYHLERFLRRCPQGMFVTAHARFHPVLKALINEFRFRHVLLLRDPRDVVVSHAFYVKREPLHFHHDYFTRTLKSDEQRIMATIRGFGPDASNGDAPLLPIGESFAGFIPWLDEPFTLAIRFEDLIGPSGGGDDEEQLAAIQRIGGFVGRLLDREQARYVAKRMYGKGSLTFRKGQAGDWRNHFTDAHRRAFKEVAGDMLIKLGYESDAGW